MAAVVGPVADSTLNLSTIGGGGGPSALRAPYTTPSAPSMADTLPSLQNFGFDDLRSRMTSFSTRFDEFIERGRMRVLEERNQFRMNVAEMNDQQQSTNRALAALKSKSSQHSQALSHQSAETAEMHSAITNLTHTRDANASHASDRRRKVASTKSSIADKRRQLKDRDAYLQYQAGFNGPECRFWEECLGLKIQGAGREDRVRFSFVFGRGSGSRNSSETEAWFELDMSGTGATGGKGYEVVRAKPHLDDAGSTDRVDACVREMCEKEDLGSFLKGMRQIFLDAIR